MIGLPYAQKKLEETEFALSDLEERYRQANATIKEKDYLISNLLRSGEQTVRFKKLALLFSVVAILFSSLFWVYMLTFMLSGVELFLSL